MSNIVQELDKLEDINYTLKGLVALCSDIAEVKAQANGVHVYEHHKIILLERIIADVLTDLQKVTKRFYEEL